MQSDELTDSDLSEKRLLVRERFRLLHAQIARNKRTKYTDSGKITPITSAA